VVIEPAITLYIPNAFTPNEDGNNETFFGHGVGIQEYEMWIYDRWGENIFYSAKMENAWDGTYKGAPVEAGLYIYKFYVLDVTGQDHSYTGGVQLLR
jgi:gliding motility-associated-like protein